MAAAAGLVVLEVLALVEGAQSAVSLRTVVFGGPPAKAGVAR